MACFSFVSEATFKKMLIQEKARQLKAFEKQEKQLKDMKASGKSSKQAVSCLNRANGKQLLTELVELFGLAVDGSLS